MSETAESRRPATAPDSESRRPATAPDSESRRPATAPDSERSVLYYCPYCGGEDLRPHEASHRAWECRECTRVFSVTLIGMVVTGDRVVA